MNGDPTRPVITAWTAVSPFGLDRSSFVDGLRSGRPALADCGLAGCVDVPHQAATVPGFDVRELLGPKGTRSMDRVTALAVWAVGQLTGACPVDPADRTALVLGTMGSLQSTMDFVRPSFTAAKPYLVDPGAMPNAVMNCAAGRCAIRHGLTGPNVTLAGGRVAGLSALDHGRRLLRGGRSNRVLVGGVEEYTPARAWLERLGGSGGPLGEGCVVLQVEPYGASADRSPLAEVLQVRSQVAVDGDFGRALDGCARAVVNRAGADFADVAITSMPDRSSGVVSGTPLASLIGDTGTASALFQVAEVLDIAARRNLGGLALIGSWDREGMVSCALLRLP